MKYLIVIFIVLSFIGCEETIEKKETAVNIDVIEIKSEEFTQTKTYLGKIMEEKRSNYSFKIDGKVKLLLKVGDKVNIGDVVAILDQKDIIREVENARILKETAQQQLEESEAFIQRIRIAFKNNGVSKSDLEKHELEYKSKAAEYKQAELNYEAQKSLKTGSKIISDIYGSVSKVFVNESEYVQAGNPIIEVISNEKIIACQISRTDYEPVLKYKKAYLESENDKTEFALKRISESPAEWTNGFYAEFVIPKGEKNNFINGDIVKIKVPVKETKGIWIPIEAIMSEGEDFVFVVEKDRAVRKNIRINEVSGIKANVLGLTSNEKLVVQGMYNLREGLLVRSN